MRKATTRKQPPSYQKISATVEEDVLRMIRQRTTNVSGFLNEAARDKLYFDRLRAAADELRRKGIERDEKLYQKLGEWLDEHDARASRRRVRRVRA